MNVAKPSARAYFQRLTTSLAAGFLLFTASPAPTFAAQEKTAERWRALREEALAFEHGEGVPKNSEKAVALYCQGARSGDPEARYCLGWI